MPSLNQRRKAFHTHIQRKRLALAAIEGWSTMPRINSETLRERHPYIEAERMFCAGMIPVAQAVGMMLTDREFIAECELRGFDKASKAEAIVRNTWALRLLQPSHG